MQPNNRKQLDLKMIYLINFMINRYKQIYALFLKIQM